MDVQTSLLGLSTKIPGANSQELIASDIPLPEGRDAAEVLNIYARAYVDSAECAASAVRISGRLEIICLCRASSGDVYGFSAQSTFLHTLALLDAQAGHTAHVRAQVVECSAQPDTFKLHLSAVLELTAFAAAPVDTPFVTGISGTSALETRHGVLHVKKDVLLSEETLRLSEEADAADVTRVLVYHAAAQVTQIRFSGASACEASGQLLVTALTETDDGEVRQLLIPMPFTCSFDAPFMAEAWAECSVESLSVTAADVSFGVIDAEAVVRLRLYGAESVQNDVLLDAYAPSEAFCCETVSFDRLNCLGAVQKTFEIRESILIPKHIPDALRIAYVTAMPVLTGLFERDGKLGADVMLLTSLLCRADDGKLYAFSEDIPAQLQFDAPFTPDAKLTVTVLTVCADGSGRTPEVTYTVEGAAVLYTTEPASLVTALVSDDAPSPYSGVLIYCADVGETLWDVGKRFRVPLSSLAEWNGALTDPLDEGQAVVVVK